MGAFIELAEGGLDAAAAGQEGHARSHLAEAAPHRKNLEKLIELSEQGRRDIASLMAEDVRLAPQVDENDARRNQDGGEGEIAAQRLS